MSIKEQLFEECKKYIDKRKQTIQDIIGSNKKALLSETKSSAGDKHETGRAMLQLEMEKASQQIVVVQNMEQVLHKINITKTSEVVCLGSIVYTNKATYFLAVSVGQVFIDKTPFFVVSSASPIGKVLLGKRVGDVIIFNGQQINIEQIV